MLNLTNKTVLITGSTSGIGAGIAKSFVDTNANIILHGIETIDLVEHVIEDLSRIAKFHNQIIYMSSDLSCSSNISFMIQKIAKMFDGIDILVNNAGIQHTAPTQYFSENHWDLLLNINLSAAFHTTRLSLPSMQQKKWGRIINIASVHGLVASVNKCAYVASKHGLLGLTKVVALENANTGVTCNAICPGWVLTPLVEAQIQKNAKEIGCSYEQAKEKLLLEKQPSGKFVTPAQIGAYCKFLCSDDAEQINGGIMTMDGGWTAQ